MIIGKIMRDLLIFQGWIELVLVATALLIHYYGFSFTKMKFTKIKNRQKYHLICVPLFMLTAFFNPFFDL